MAIETITVNKDFCYKQNIQKMLSNNCNMLVNQRFFECNNKIQYLGSTL
jgi:hypothetical protein